MSTAIENVRGGRLMATSALALTLALALAGCVSAPGDLEEDGAVPVEASAGPAEETQDGSSGAVSGYRDPMVKAAGADAGGSAPSESTDDPPTFAETIMQPAQVNASQTSIFASASPAAAPGEVTPSAGTDAQATGGAITNLYQAGGGDPTGSIPPAPAQASPDEEASLVPDRVPLPTSVRTALVAESGGNEAQRALDQSVAGGETGAMETASDAGAIHKAAKEAANAPVNSPTGAPETKLTLAALFATKRKSPTTGGAEKPSTARKTSILNRESASAYQTASLAPTALPGVTTALTVAPQDHSEVEEDAPDAADGNDRVTEVASLAGLARLSPNGLWLQTEKVSTGCFKPELLGVLKSIEQHYGKPVIVTSGVRPMKRNRTKQSLHTQCAAADIQIAGVSRWELAEYLRTMPGRGGVGTYCHTESVHIDIGPARDWNWKCRSRRK